jgi:coenzyme F420-dependent glucose-6-phosphate dehydrogenase
MPTVGYHASHEQFAPRALLGYVQRAEQAGFATAMCSDHFHPWLEAQGQSGHAWTWLGSALATTGLGLGVVTCPIGRYHPAVIAQAAATLVQMHGPRFWLAVGTGEALNESITGEPWPPKRERQVALAAAVEAMRALWRGETVSRTGAVRVREARLYSLPEAPPPLFGAALTEETARRVAGWADGLVTVSTGDGRERRVLEAFRAHGGEGKPAALQVKLAFGRDDADALAGAHAQWRANVLDGELTEELRTPAQFAAAAQHVRPEDVARAVRVSADPARHRGWLEDDLAAGFDALLLHDVHPDQARFIDAFGEHVLPGLG